MTKEEWELRLKIPPIQDCARNQAIKELKLLYIELTCGGCISLSRSTARWITGRYGKYKVMGFTNESLQSIHRHYVTECYFRAQKGMLPPGEGALRSDSITRAGRKKRDAEVRRRWLEAQAKKEKEERLAKLFPDD